MHLTGCASRWGMNNITAYWMGFCQYHGAGLSLAAHDGLQAAGASPLIWSTSGESRYGSNGDSHWQPANWERAIAVQSASLGEFNAVTDAEIQTPIDFGIRRRHFCEPASAASVAGLLKVKDKIPTGATVVLCSLQWPQRPRYSNTQSKFL